MDKWMPENTNLGTWLLSKVGHWRWEHTFKTCPTGDRHCPHMHYVPHSPYVIVRELIVNNRWAARRRTRKLPQELIDQLVVAMMEPESELTEDPEFPGMRFTPQAREGLERLRKLAGESDA
jgi:hypothetical protein